MAKTDRKSASSPHDADAKASPDRDRGPFPVMDPTEVSRMGRRNIDAANRATRALVTGTVRLNRASFEFVSRRIASDVDAARKIMTARSGESAMHAHAEFVETALKDYARHFSDMFTMAADMARDAYMPVEARAEEVLHAIDERAAPDLQNPAAA